MSKSTLLPPVPNSQPAAQAVEADVEVDEEILAFQSLLKTKILNKPKPIKTSHASSATWVLEKRREMQEVQQALDSQKKDFEQHEVDMKKREEALDKKDRELQESLLKFNRFLLDNDAKRAKAERKYLEEKSLKEEKEAEVEQLAKTLEHLKKEKQEKQNLLANLIQYQRYLHTTLEQTEDYKEIKALIDRWNTLQATSEQLRESIAHNIRESETTRTALKKYSQDKATEILALDNRIAELTKYLEKMEHKIISATSEYDEKTESSVAKTLEFGQIKMACENIFRQIVDKQKVTKQKTLTIPQQLEYIESYLSDLQEIIKGYKSHSKPNP